MSINLLNLAYFSPTGTTRKILESIATGIAPAMTEFTDLSAAGAELCFDQKQPELAIIGMPTYAGRIPPEGANLLKRFLLHFFELNPAGKNFTFVATIF